VGTRVKGGEHYGGTYDLTSLDDGDLRPQLDFRSVYATIIRHWLGGDPDIVLGKHYEQLGFIEPVARRRIVAP